MNNIANKTSLWNYIEHTSVVIPKLQRDYAQGRKGKENLRENFLSTLRDALDKALQTKGYQLKLDFVYGSSNEDAQFTFRWSAASYDVVAYALVYSILDQ